MFRSPTKAEEYIPLASQPDGESLESNDEPIAPGTTSSVTNHLLWACVLIAGLSALNVAFLPYTHRSFGAAIPLSDHELNDLPYPDQNLGLERAAKAIPSPLIFHHAWPERIARLSQKLKDSVYGSGTEVFVSVEDTTIMQFPVPPHGSPACALAWFPPPKRSARIKDLETKGDVSEIEVWSIIAANPTTSATISNLDFDTLSWNTHPVRGELLGTLDLTSHPNATTVEFACPTDVETLTVEFRCLRVACHIKFRQIQMIPKLGFELVRRYE